VRDLLTKVMQKQNASDPNPKVTTYEYNDNGLVSK
jgi:hypothetical protein